MKSMMQKTTMREIKKSFGRFAAIMAIVALGVGLFAGLKVTKSVMVSSVDEYLREKNFYDFRLLSTMGFSKEDIKSLQDMPDVKAAQGAVFKDILYINQQGNEEVIKVHSLTDEVNGLVLKAGRMPQTANECVVDSNLYGENALGARITFSDNNTEEDLEFFTSREFEIVGIVDSSYYMNFERGNTSLGSGRIAGFMYIPPEGFDCDYFMEIFVAFDSKEAIYTEEYQAFVDAKEAVWEDTAQFLADNRYEEIVTQAEAELADAKQELADKSAEGEQELADALKELTDGEAELADGEKQLADAKEEISKREKELQDGKEELVQGREELNSQETTLLQKEQELKSSEQELISQEQKLNGTEAELRASLTQLDTKKAELEAYLAILEAQYQNAPTEELKKMLESCRSGLAEIETNRALVNGGLSQIQAGRGQITAYWNQLAEGKVQIEEGKKQIEEGRRKLSEAEQEIADGEAKIADGKREISEKEAEISDAKAELSEGRQEYEEAKAEFDTEVADARQEIADAEEEMAKLAKPDVYVLGRNTNIGYVCFENDASIVEGIANVFPVFFFLVAALVCITTMNRMVEEQRTQIGVLKALGYGKLTIMSKYMIYSGSAAVAGCVTGFLVGTHLFPYVIWTVYHIMYNLGELSFVFDWKLAIISLIVSLLCSLGTTWFSCRYELKEAAAELMRPKAPKAGKRVLLERLPFVWKRLKFLHKVSVRNIFRYKKRFFMMIIGIGGCTALLVTGFGIKDSIANVAVQQFEEIQTYDASVTFSKAKDIFAENEFTKESEAVAENYLYAMEKTIDLEAGNKVKSINLVVPQEEEKAAAFLNLHTAQKESVAYPQAGECVISHKIADNFQVKKGDTIKLRDENMKEVSVTVSGIFENFVYNYVILSAETYQEKFGQEPEYKTAYVNFKEDQDIYQAAAVYMKSEDVSGVTINADIQERFGSMLSSLNYIVLLVIACAALLAFIVLYNLTNINITERVREIATIKVLGFYKKETSAYVFRENMVLTAIGSMIGLGLGYLLHGYVMHEVNIDMIAFDIHISLFSYAVSILLTFLFAIFINQVMSVKLEKINMAESLKSVD